MFANDASERYLSAQASAELADQLVTAAGQIAAATCTYLGLLARFDASASCFTPECKSAAHWLGWRCGESLAGAREQVRVARCLAVLPQIHTSFSRGELSYSQVRALVRVATPETEGSLLKVARYCSGSQLATLMRAYRRVLEAEATAAAQQMQAQRRLSYHFDDEGFFVLQGRLTPEEGTVVQAALEQAVAELSAAAPVRPVGSAEGLPGDSREAWSALRADALLVLAEGSLARGLAGRCAPERTQVIVHVDAETLAGTGYGEHCELQDGPPLAPETTRRMACDATLIALVEDASGAPLAVGRRTRKISPALRRALRSRDGGCVFPGCGQWRFVEGHHVRHWAAGGETSLENLASLCWWHHKLVHEGGYRLVMGEAGFNFYRPDGMAVERSPGMGPCEGRLDVVVDPANLLSRAERGRADYGYILSCLLQDDSRVRSPQDYRVHPQPPTRRRAGPQPDEPDPQEDEEWLPVSSWDPASPQEEPDPDPAICWWLQLDAEEETEDEPGPGAAPGPVPGPPEPGIT
ncbi:MAG: hypothetical protein NVSMB32_09370 [Actinomycetota bacterium]